MTISLTLPMHFRNQLARRLFPGKTFFVQVLSAGGLAATGDVISQKLLEKREHWDPWRTSRFALITASIIAPIQFHWFRFMERHINGGAGRAATGFGGVKRVSLRTGLKRVLVDQSLVAPVLTGTFLLSLNFIDSLSANHAIERTKRIYLDVMKNNYKFWPFVQIVNLTLVPLHLRVVFLQFFGIFWNIYLSFRANN